MLHALQLCDIGKSEKISKIMQSLWLVRWLLVEWEAMMTSFLIRTFISYLLSPEHFPYMWIFLLLYHLVWSKSPSKSVSVTWLSGDPRQSLLQRLNPSEPSNQTLCLERCTCSLCFTTFGAHNISTYHHHHHPRIVTQGAQKHTNMVTVVMRVTTRMILMLIGYCLFVWWINMRDKRQWREQTE